MTEKRTSTRAAQLQRTVLIELDFAVLQALKPQAEVCCAVLAKSGIEWDESLFLRHFVGRTMAQGLQAVAQKSGQTFDAPALSGEIAEGCRNATARLMSENKPLFGTWVEQLLSKDTRIVFLTGVPDAMAQAELGSLCGGHATIFCEPQILCGCYGWENWRHTARKLRIRERLSVALVGSGLSAKGALSAGMHVIARPDPLAEYQDFSGADLLFQKIDSSVNAAILRMLRLHA